MRTGTSTEIQVPGQDEFWVKHVAHHRNTALNLHLEGRGVLPQLRGFLTLLPFVQRVVYCLCVPATLGDFFVVDVQRRDPINILALPTLLACVLNINYVQGELTLRR